MTIACVKKTLTKGSLGSCSLLLEIDHPRENNLSSKSLGIKSKSIFQKSIEIPFFVLLGVKLY